LLWHGKPISLLALPASIDFFSMLGAEAEIGRTFGEVDLKNPFTLMLACPYWQKSWTNPTTFAHSN
jgi:hypothetical protein